MAQVALSENAEKKSGRRGYTGRFCFLPSPKRVDLLDEEVIAAANEHGIAMIFTGMRHFRH